MKNLMVAVALIACAPRVSLAQTEKQTIDTYANKFLGTTEIVFHKDTADGILEGCGLEFSALGRDTARGGQLYKINGSYYTRTSGSSIHGFLKLGVWDYSKDLTNPPKPFAPPRAFISGVNKPAARPASSMKSDNPAYSLHIFRFDENLRLALESVSDNKRIDVIFNRYPGRMDTATAIDLTVKSSKILDDRFIKEHSDDMLSAFHECSLQILKLVESRLQQIPGK